MHESCMSASITFSGCHVHLACTHLSQAACKCQPFVHPCVLKHKCPCGLVIVIVSRQQLQQLQRPGLLFENNMHADHAGQDEDGLAVADPLLLGGDRSPDITPKQRKASSLHMDWCLDV